MSNLDVDANEIAQLILLEKFDEANELWSEKTKDFNVAEISALRNKLRKMDLKPK